MLAGKRMLLQTPAKKQVGVSAQATSAKKRCQPVLVS